MLVIEDGTIVVDANSYVDIAYFTNYASLRGIEIPDEPTAEKYLIRACDWINCQDKELQGYRISPTQELAYPRNNVTVNGFIVEYNEIPTILKKLQCQLACEQIAGINILPSNDQQIVKKEIIGELSTEYMPTGGYVNPSMPLVDGLLQPLLKQSGGMFLTSVRV